MAEGVEAGPRTQQPEKEKSSPWKDRFSKVWDSKLGRRATSLVALAALSLGPTSEIKGGPLQLRRHSEVTPIVLSLPSGTTFDFTDPGEFKPDTKLHYVEPNEDISKFLNATDASLTELGLMPLKIQDKEKFQKWIMQQSRRDDILQATGVGNINTASPRQLVKLASAIVSANFQYTNFNEMTGKEREALDIELHRTDRTPMDVVLEHGADYKVACYQYATANVAIFDQIKQMPQFREKLRNVYLISQNSETANGKSKFSHSWNAAVFVKAPDRAYVTYIDPTADDPDWLTPANVYDQDFFNNITLIRSLRERGVMSDPIFQERILHSVRSGEIGTKDLSEILGGMEEKAEVSAIRIRLLEEYLAQPTNEFDRRDKENQLFDLYINPANAERPEDWQDRAKKLGQKLIDATKKKTAKRLEQYTTLPTTQEEYDKRYAPYVYRDSAFRDPIRTAKWWEE